MSQARLRAARRRERAVHLGDHVRDVAQAAEDVFGAPRSCSVVQASARSDRRAAAYFFTTLLTEGRGGGEGLRSRAGSPALGQHRGLTVGAGAKRLDVVL